MSENWVELSLLLEQVTGYDSIPTIEGHYATDTGSFRCVMPKCKFTQHGSYDMWRHVHFAPAHRDAFGGRTTYAELSEYARSLGASA